MLPRNVLAWCCLIFGCLAFGQDAKEEQEVPEQATGLQTIVVTATKMGESKLQETPITASVLSEDDLQQAGVENAKDMVGLVPGVQVAQNSKWGQLYIRGIGTNNVFVGSDPSSTIHMDGVYLGRPTMVFLDLLDLERIEVLRGPQGTLYGRNSLGGTLNFISRKPSNVPENTIQLDVGRFSKRRISGRLSGPLVRDKVMASVSFLKSDRDGYVTNINPQSNSPELNDEDSLAARVSLRFLLGSHSDLLVTADYNEQDDQSAVHKPFLVTPAGDPVVGPLVIEDPYTISTPLDPRLELEQTGLMAKYETRIGSLTFLSTTAYRTADLFSFSDADYTEFPDNQGILDEEHQQFSQEFQLNGGNDRWNWVAGLFYLQEDLDFFANIELPILADLLGLPSFVSNIVDKAETEAWAGYFQADYQFNLRLTGTFGFRYSSEDKRIEGVSALLAGGVPFATFDVQGDDDWTAFTPKFGLDYQVNEQAMVYASATRGFKSGGYNFSADAEAFDPEFLWSYEVGLKSQGLDNRLRFNAAAFLYDYTDLQVQAFIPPSPDRPNAQVAITNAATAEVTGVEVESVFRPVSGLTFNGAVAYLDATYDDFVTATSADPPVFVDVSGNVLNSSPEWSYTFQTQYDYQLGSGSLHFWGHVQWLDRAYYTAFNQSGTSQPGYELVHADISYRTKSDRWRVSLYGHNLTDEVYYNSTADFSNFGVTGLINPPRTYGAKIVYNF